MSQNDFSFISAAGSVGGGEWVGDRLVDLCLDQRRLMEQQLAMMGVTIGEASRDQFILALEGAKDCLTKMKRSISSDSHVPATKMLRMPLGRSELNEPVRLRSLDFPRLVDPLAIPFLEVERVTQVPPKVCHIGDQALSRPINFSIVSNRDGILEVPIPTMQRAAYTPLKAERSGEPGFRFLVPPQLPPRSLAGLCQTTGVGFASNTFDDAEKRSPMDPLGRVASGVPSWDMRGSQFEGRFSAQPPSDPVHRSTCERLTNFLKREFQEGRSADLLRMFREIQRPC